MCPPLDIHVDRDGCGDRHYPILRQLKDVQSVIVRIKYGNIISPGRGNSSDGLLVDKSYVIRSPFR